MKKVIIGVIVVVILIVMFIGLTPQEPIQPKAKKMVDEETRRMITTVIQENLGGDAVVEDITLQEKCVICDDDCVTYNYSCWKVNVTQNGISSEGTVAQEGGSDSSPEIVDITTPETSCRYFYTEENPQFNIEHYNNDCNNPVPACDQTQHICRACTSDMECVITEVITNMQSGMKVYKYHVIGTVFNGRYNESDASCIIDDSTIIIYSNITSFEYCKDEIFSHPACKEAGECYFI